MLIENPAALQTWLVKVLAKLSEANPDALSKYVMALIKKENKNENELKKICIEQLDVFLQEETESFVNKLFDVIINKTYHLSSSKEKNRKEVKSKQLSSESDSESSGSDQGYKGNKSHKSSTSNTKLDEDKVKDVNNKNNPYKFHSSKVKINESDKILVEVKEKVEINKVDNISIPVKKYEEKKSKNLIKPQKLSVGKSKVNAKNQKTREFLLNKNGGCRDYNEKGFCMRGGLCPFDHGKDALVLSGNMNPLPFVTSSSDKVNSSSSLVIDTKSNALDTQVQMPISNSSSVSSESILGTPIITIPPQPPSHVTSLPLLPTPQIKSGLLGESPITTLNYVRPHLRPMIPPLQLIRNSNIRILTPFQLPPPPPFPFYGQYSHLLKPFIAPNGRDTNNPQNLHVFPTNSPELSIEANQYNPENPSLLPNLSNHDNSILKYSNSPMMMMNISTSNANTSNHNNNRRIVKAIKNKYYNTNFSFNNNLAQKMSGAGNRENRILELRKIPNEMNTISLLNAYFQKFGQLTNIIVNYDDDPQGALVTFSSNAEAYKAYKCQDPIFNNRFVKVFWHNAQPDEPFPTTTSTTSTTLPKNLHVNYYMNNVANNKEKDPDELDGENLVRFMPPSFNKDGGYSYYKKTNKFNLINQPEETKVKGYDESVYAARIKKFCNSTAPNNARHQGTDDVNILLNEADNKIIKLNEATNVTCSSSTELLLHTDQENGDDNVTGIVNASSQTASLINSNDKQRLELTRARYELLLKRIENQKQLIDKMSQKPAIFSGSVRSTAIETMRELKESIEKIKNELDLFQHKICNNQTIDSTTTPTTTTILNAKEELIKLTKKQILDAELELISKSHQTPTIMQFDGGLLDKNLSNSSLSELRDIQLRLRRLKRKKANIFFAGSTTFKNHLSNKRLITHTSYIKKKGIPVSAMPLNFQGNDATHVDRRPKTIVCEIYKSISNEEVNNQMDYENKISCEELKEFLGIKLYPITANIAQNDETYFAITFHTRREAEYFIGKVNSLEEPLEICNYKLSFRWERRDNNSFIAVDPNLTSLNNNISSAPFRHDILGMDDISPDNDVVLEN